MNLKENMAFLKGVKTAGMPKEIIKAVDDTLSIVNQYGLSAFETDEEFIDETKQLVKKIKSFETKEVANTPIFLQKKATKPIQKEQEAAKILSKTTHKVGDIVFDTIKNQNAKIRKISKPKDNTPFFGEETQIADIIRADGTKVMNMKGSLLTKVTNQDIVIPTPKVVEVPKPVIKVEPVAVTTKPKPLSKEEKALEKKKVIVESLQVEFKTLKDEVIANAKYKENLAAELKKHLSKTGLGSVNKADKVSSMNIDEKIVFLKENIKFYKNLLRGDNADFKAIAKRVGLEYRQNKARTKTEAKEINEPMATMPVPTPPVEVPVAKKRVLFNPSTYFERYNGGWTKSIVGLNKNLTDGFSIIGDFTESDKKVYFNVGKLYLDCGIGGSRKNQTKYYNVFTINENEEVEIIGESRGRSWAVDLWDDIEKYNKEHDPNFPIKDGLGSVIKPKEVKKSGLVTTHKQEEKQKKTLNKFINWWNN